VGSASAKSSIFLIAPIYFKEAALHLASVGRGGDRMALFVSEVYRPIITCSHHLSTAKPAEVFRLCGKGKNISQTQGINLQEIKQMLRVLKVDGIKLDSTELKDAFLAIESNKFSDINEAIAVADLSGGMTQGKKTTLGLDKSPNGSLTGYGIHAPTVNFGVWNVAHLIDRSARVRSPRLHWKRAYRAVIKMSSEMRMGLRNA